MRAILFDGTFEFDFLRDGEAVRSAGKDSHAVEIIDRYDSDRVIIRVKVGEYLVRRDDGTLAVENDDWPEFIEA